MTPGEFKHVLFELLGKNDFQKVLKILHVVLPVHEASDLHNDARDLEFELKALDRAVAKAPQHNLQFAKIKQRIKGNLFDLIEKFKERRRGREINVPRNFFPDYSGPATTRGKKNEVDMSLPWDTGPKETDLPIYDDSGKVDMSLPWQKEPKHPKKEDMSLPWEKTGGKKKHTTPSKEDMSLPWETGRPTEKKHAASTFSDRDAGPAEESEVDIDWELPDLDLGMDLPWESESSGAEEPEAPKPYDSTLVDPITGEETDIHKENKEKSSSAKETLDKATSWVKGILQQITPNSAFNPVGTFLLSIHEEDSSIENYQIELLPEGTISGEKALKSNASVKAKTPLFGIPIKLGIPGKIPIKIKGTWEYNEENKELDVKFQIGMQFFTVHCKFNTSEIQDGRIYGKEVGSPNSTAYLAKVKFFGRT